MVCIQQNIHQTSIRGIVDLSYRNLMFLELELNCVPNRSTCYRNSTVELLCGKVGEAELKKIEQSSPKQPLKRGTGTPRRWRPSSLSLCVTLSRVTAWNLEAEDER